MRWFLLGMLLYCVHMIVASQDRIVRLSTSTRYYDSNARQYRTVKPKNRVEVEVVRGALVRICQDGRWLPEEPAEQNIRVYIGGVLDSQRFNNFFEAVRYLQQVEGPKARPK